MKTIFAFALICVVALTQTVKGDSYKFPNHIQYDEEKYVYANLSPKDLELRFNGDKAKFKGLAKCYLQYAGCDIKLEVDAYRQLRANVTKETCDHFNEVLDQCVQQLGELPGQDWELKSKGWCLQENYTQIRDPEPTQEEPEAAPTEHSRASGRLSRLFGK